MVFGSYVFLPNSVVAQQVVHFLSYIVIAANAVFFSNLL